MFREILRGTNNGHCTGELQNAIPGPEFGISVNSPFTFASLRIRKQCAWTVHSAHATSYSNSTLAYPRWDWRGSVSSSGGSSNARHQGWWMDEQKKRDVDAIALSGVQGTLLDQQGPFLFTANMKAFNRIKVPHADKEEGACFWINITTSHCLKYYYVSWF